MIMGIDFGSTTTDVVLMDKKITKLLSIKSDKKSDVDDIMEKVIKKNKINLNKIKQINITGGHSRSIKQRKYKAISIKKINEIKAIGKGGSYISKNKNCLVVSLGTGTCLISVKNNKIKHIGGSGIGGGTITGLSSRFLGIDDIEKLEKLSKKGNLKNVDLSIKESVGGRIGIVSGDVTASNLAKLSRKKASRADISAGLLNMLGQSIAMMLVYAAQANNQRNVILIGKTVQFKKVFFVIKKVLARFKLNCILPNNSEYATAIGAALG
ncbi:BadF/BadG/BcrA/BcrD ATPase family protein [Nanoarchaeota archaeon]